MERPGPEWVEMMRGTGTPPTHIAKFLAEVDALNAEKKELEDELQLFKDAVTGAIAIKDLWLYPVPIAVEHETEAEALQLMLGHFEELIKPVTKGTEHG